MSNLLGQRLQQARQARNLTIEQVARATHLRPHHIQAIEEGRLDAFPSPVQARAFLRLYADYLGLVLDELVARSTGEASPPAAAPAAIRAGPETAPPAPSPRAPDAASAPPSSPDEALVASAAATAPTDRNATAESQAIFRAIGATLRRQRETLSLRLEDVAGQIHLRPQTLHALEAGEFADLPSPVQARGMLQNYAHFLGLDTEALLLRFAEGLQRQHQEQLTARAAPRSRRAPSRRLPAFLYGDLLGGIFLIFLLIVGAIWGTSRVIQQNRQPALTATLPSVSEILLHSPTATEGEAALPAAGAETPAAQSEETRPALPATVTVEGRVQVVLVALQRVWVRVVVDGRVAQEGRLLPGQAYPFGGEERIEVLAADGAALQILYNQKDLGVIGSRAQVVNLVFTAGGIQTPTPTVTPTPTASPSPTITPRPSPTARPSATPRP